MRLRDAILRTIAAVLLFIFAMAYMTVIVPKDGVIDLRESIVTVLSIVFALLLVIHAWWTLVWNRIMLAIERWQNRKTKPETDVGNQYAEASDKPKPQARKNRGKRKNKARSH